MIVEFEYFDCFCGIEFSNEYFYLYWKVECIILIEGL